MKAKKTPLEQAKERFAQRMAGEAATAQRNVEEEAMTAFYQALGLTVTQAKAVSQFDKKHVLDKLLPAWVKLFERGTGVEAKIEANHQAHARHTEQLINLLAQKFLQQVGPLNEAVEQARATAWDRGYIAAKTEAKQAELEQGAAQLGMDANANWTSLRG